MVGAPQQRSCPKSWWLSSLDTKKNSVEAHLSRQVERVMVIKCTLWVLNGYVERRILEWRSVMPKHQCWKCTEANKEICTNPIFFFGTAKGEPVNRSFLRHLSTCAKVAYFQCWSLQAAWRWDPREAKRSTSRTDFTSEPLQKIKLIDLIDLIATWSCHNCFHGLLTSHTLDDWCQSSMTPLRLFTWSNSVTMVGSSSGPSTAALTAVLSSPHLKHSKGKILASRASLNS